MPLFALFVAVPLIEIALFIQIGGLIGLWPTLAVVLLSAVVGTSLMRSQGAKAWTEVQRSFSEMRDPTRPMAHGLMIVIAGMLLLTPGFFTDTIGLLLLIPPVRDAVMGWLSGRININRVQMGGAGMRRDDHRPPYGEGVIDGDYIVDPDPRDPRSSRTPPDLPHDLSDDGGTGPRRSGPSGWTRH